jgi:hypothetical protein
MGEKEELFGEGKYAAQRRDGRKNGFSIPQNLARPDDRRRGM